MFSSKMLKGQRKKLPLNLFFSFQKSYDLINVSFTQKRLDEMTKIFSNLTKRFMVQL